MTINAGLNELGYVKGSYGISGYVNHLTFIV